MLPGRRFWSMAAFRLGQCGLRCRVANTATIRSAEEVGEGPAFRHQVVTHGPQTEFGYNAFIPQFRAEHFDPNSSLLRLFERLFPAST